MNEAGNEARSITEGLPEWRPIKTAPKDGTQILVCWETKKTVRDIPAGVKVCAAVRYETEELWFVCAHSDRLVCIDNPTHWMPLPAPPEAP